MKRAPFLGAVAAVFASGCGGRSATGVLPARSPSSVAGTALNAADPAEPIPQNVLTNPILGEVRRFDGTVAPANWALCQGQTLQTTSDPSLFKVLGTAAGGDGKTTFALPKSSRGFIIAVAGALPTSPLMLQSLGRHMTAADSLGTGAVRAPIRTPSARERATLEQREKAAADARTLMASGIQPRAGVARAVPSDLQARIDADREQSRTVALSRLSAANRARAESLAASVLARSSTLPQAIVSLRSSLSADEANGVLDVLDATQRTFHTAYVASPRSDLLGDGARYVMSIAFTARQREQLDAMGDGN